MEGLKSVSQAALLVLGIALIVMLQSGEAQVCTTQLNNLNVCGQFVVPGANSQPSTECCSALRSVDHDCFCNTLRIASRLPSLCDIPPLSCGGTESEELRILMRPICILQTGSCRNDGECLGICFRIGVGGRCSYCRTSNVCCCCSNIIRSFNQISTQLSCSNLEKKTNFGLTHCF